MTRQLLVILALTLGASACALEAETDRTSAPALPTVDGGSVPDLDPSPGTPADGAPPPTLGGFGDDCADDEACASGLCLRGEDGFRRCSRECALTDDAWCNDEQMLCVPIDMAGALGCNAPLPYDLGDDGESATLRLGEVRVRALTEGDVDLYRLSLPAAGDYQLGFRPLSPITVQLDFLDPFGTPVPDVRISGLGSIRAARFASTASHVWVLVRNDSELAADYSLSLDLAPAD